jgi:putative ABC transport system permease protein
MRNAFNKDVFREIKGTLGRFLAIFAIVALGVSFFAGLSATGKDMKITGNSYFNAQNLMDLRVISTYGISKKDLEAIASSPGVKRAVPAYNIDAEVKNNTNRSCVLKVHSIDIKSNQNSLINKPVVKVGRLPQKANEAVAEIDFYSEMGYSIGDKVTLGSGKSINMRNSLKNVTFELVGAVESPYYISLQRGSGSIGDGRINYYMYIPEQNFLQEAYSEAFVTVAGAVGLTSFSEQYEADIDIVANALEEIGKQRAKKRLNEIRSGPYRELNSEREAVIRMLNDYEDQFADSEAQLAESRSGLEDSRKDMSIKKGEVTSGANEITSSESQLYAGLNEIDIAEAELLKQREDLIASVPDIDSQISDLMSQQKALLENEAMLYIVYRDDPDTLISSLTSIEEAKTRISSGLLELNGAKNEIDRGLYQVDSAKLQLDVQRFSLLRSLQTLINEKQSLTEAESEILKAYSTISDSENLLADNLSELVAARQQTLAELNGAISGIQEGLKHLKDMDEPEWFVLDRETNMGYSAFREDADKIDAIGKVFPLIFFLVAALVSLTTMTRLVEERRIEIGTLKSLGYGNLKIISKYIIYALTPTLTGGLIGGYVGMKLYPKLIIDAYKMFYVTPKPETPLDYGYWALGVIIAVACTVGASLFSCLNELRETPSELMRPKAPKSGRRTFLEYLSFIWSFLTFIQKVTIRNLIRYKKRFWMTVVGIAGCTALLVTGFGLRDSISDIMGIQYTDIFKYDMATTFTDSAKQNDIKKIQDDIAKSPYAKSSLLVRSKILDAGVEKIKTVSAMLIVPEDAQNMDDFILLRDRVSKVAVPVEKNSVVITEKMAKLLELEIGDSFFIKDGDDMRAEVICGGITEHYVSHYIYMDKELYSELFRETPEYNSVYTILKNPESGEKNELAREVLEKKSVTSVWFTSSMIESFANVVDGLNFVVFVLIFSAGALALVVLLNLTSINISERIRELATIEVLGFYDNEMSAYVYRENAVLTAIGAIAGIGLGIAMHLYIILTAETEITMFGRQIKPMSFIYSVLLTVFFSVFVNLLTARRLKRINMVEALKSIE